MNNHKFNPSLIFLFENNKLIFVHWLWIVVIFFLFLFFTVSDFRMARKEWLNLSH